MQQYLITKWDTLVITTRDKNFTVSQLKYIAKCDSVITYYDNFYKIKCEAIT